MSQGRDDDMLLVADQAAMNGFVNMAALRTGIDNLYEAHRPVATRLYKVNSGGNYGFVAVMGSPSVSSDGRIAVINENPNMVIYNSSTNEILVVSRGRERIYKNVIRPTGVPAGGVTGANSVATASVSYTAGVPSTSVPVATTNYYQMNLYHPSVQPPTAAAVGRISITAPSGAPVSDPTYGMIRNPPPACVPGRMAAGRISIAATSGPDPHLPSVQPTCGGVAPFVPPVCVPKRSVDPITVCPFNTAQDQQTAQVCAQKPAECADVLNEMRCKLRARVQEYSRRH